MCVIAGLDGTRHVPVEDFCVGPGRNVLAPHELLVSLRFPAPRARTGSAYLRFIPREEMDIAVVGVGASVVLEGDRIAAARVGIGAVAPTPLRVKEAEDQLIGEIAGPAAYAKAAAASRDASRPISDMRGTAEHRRHLVGVLTTRALERAVERAAGRPT
jgi:CO/xanthine dehydrogenase FAD-binding subunit